MQMCFATRFLTTAMLCAFFTSAGGASLAAQVRREKYSQEATYRFRAGSTAKLALHAHAKNAATAGLRRATAFRASRAGTSNRASLRGGLSARQVPLYVPKVGLANVTEPTAFPPPPPVLHPWQDNQPMDTAVGNYIISGFITPPTATPPPTQESLDLAFACPVLLTWQNEISVSVPDECQSESSGNLTGVNDGPLLLNWETTCLDHPPGLHTPQFSSMTTYTTDNGDLFGTSGLEAQGPWRDVIVLRDCGGVAVYTIEEKVYKQDGEPIEEVCQKYGSCDGVVYLQYFIKDASGTTIGMTPYLTIFQRSFTITDPNGILIASASRNGWDPKGANGIQKPSECTGERKVWHLKFAANPPGIWQSTANQWPIAEMMTMLSQRDMLRKPNGRVIWSNCEVMKATGLFSSIVLLILACMCCPFFLFIFCSGPCAKSFHYFEKRYYPERMGRPSMYGN